MNAIQVAASNPAIYVRKNYQPHHFLSTPKGLSMNANPLSRTFLIPRAKLSSGLYCVRQSATTAPVLKVYPSNLTQSVPVLKSQKPRHVCLAGGKGMMDNSEDSQRKSLEEAMKSLQEKIQKGEYSGGSGSKPPGGRGRGGGGGNSDGSEEGSTGGMSDETAQIVFATIGFMFVYIYVINGVELTKLARDFIKYLLGGTQSVRLKRASYKCSRFYKKITGQNEVDEDGLETGPLRWNIADFYRDVLRNYMKPNSNE
ncbi:hypothetical protein MtrunA17_Chr6g0453501 [Medicago truncatula]|uniref:Transmembrane protein, putative n=1 Tax=Medicago truncatula TaxID=3880 RepID=G7KKY4_MEDTR|nr:transmembrane protein, putative [Medicago truncatula]RHN50075.1 hypothetical protein MtrunA17_Chr6g0453501 [Medicago truncatula]